MTFIAITTMLCSRGMTSSLAIMDYKTQQLSKSTDSQILQSFTPKFDEFLTYWDGGSHPEVLYNDGLYCELIAEKLTDEEKAE